MVRGSGTDSLIDAMIEFTTLGDDCPQCGARLEVDGSKAECPECGFNNYE